MEHKIDFAPHHFLVRLVEVSFKSYMIGYMFLNIRKKLFYVRGVYGSL